MQLKPIEGHENYYVSDNGTVISLPRVGEGRELQPDYVNGHARVKLGGKHNYIGRLVLEAFIGPKPKANYKVFHINGDTTDDSVDNLVWLPHSIAQLYSKYSRDYRASERFKRQVLAQW